jgi:hypothetical protein
MMSFQFTLVRLFVATGVVALFLGVAQPKEPVEVAAALAAAGALVSLILLANRGNIRRILRSAAFTLAGVCFASLLNADGLLHPPVSFIICGGSVGWAIGIVTEWE